jgi:hypothetical protein
MYVMQTCCVFFEVRTELLNVTLMKFVLKRKKKKKKRKRKQKRLKLGGGQAYDRSSD